ncbi:MAG: substrate-binding domain-containing protein [Streptosporangiales bacterium]|nr:substrate-binding domain-containing protein [Streptosporangiales bacterium]
MALAALAAVLAAGCGAEVRESGGSGEAKQEGPIRLAVVPKAVGFDFWEQVRKGAECAASKQQDVTVQWDGVTKETDVTGQVNLLQNYITQGVDGLVYAATDAKVLYQVTQSAKQNNVNVINIDSGTDPQPPDVPVFATDNVAAAEKAADLLADSLGEGKKKIAFIPFQPGTITNDQRTEGFKKGLQKHPNLDLVAEQSSESDYNTGLQVTEDILTDNPDLDGIFAANEPGVLGAAEAVRQAGKEGDIKIIGWDAAPDEIKAVNEGVISALVVQNPFRMGYEGVNGAVTAIREGKQVSSADTGVTFVTKENMNDPEVQSVLKPSCENPPVEGGGGA